jgi:hypothetical protein
MLSWISGASSGLATQISGLSEASASILLLPFSDKTLASLTNTHPENYRQDLAPIVEQWQAVCVGYLVCCVQPVEKEYSQYLLVL